MFAQTLDPSDTCGCGDVGYLTTRTIPVDLAHGVGHIENVPIYHCRSKSCQEYTLPQSVTRRIEDIAEEMENTGAKKAVYTWSSAGKQNSASRQQEQANVQAHLQAFTLQFSGREYEDARVVLVVPGQAVFLQSALESSEYYLLHFEANYPAEGIWFSFFKFYYEEPDLTYEKFLTWSEDGYLKEIGCLNIEDVEDALLEEFGAWE